MTQEIIEMARQAGLLPEKNNVVYQHSMFEHYIKTFAKLVAAKEREACAMLCESEWDGDADTYESTRAYNECAAAIRARGQS